MPLAQREEVRDGARPGLGVAERVGAGQGHPRLDPVGHRSLAGGGENQLLVRPQGEPAQGVAIRPGGQQAAHLVQLLRRADRMAAGGAQRRQQRQQQRRRAEGQQDGRHQRRLLAAERDGPRQPHEAAQHRLDPGQQPGVAGDRLAELQHQQSGGQRRAAEQQEQSDGVGLLLRVGVGAEVPPGAEQDAQPEQAQPGLLHVQALDHVHDRAGGQQRDRDGPGPALAPAQPARHEDQEQAEHDAGRGSAGRDRQAEQLHDQPQAPALGRQQGRHDADAAGRHDQVRGHGGEPLPRRTGQRAGRRAGGRPGQDRCGGRGHSAPWTCSDETGVRAAVTTGPPNTRPALSSSAPPLRPRLS